MGISVLVGSLVVRYIVATVVFSMVVRLVWLWFF